MYLVDINENILERLPDFIKEEAVVREHETFYPENPLSEKSLNEIENYAKNLLEEYRENASLVVTSRLHCALPCVAMGIPVVFIREKVSKRFDFISDIIKIYTVEEIPAIKWNDVKSANIEKLKEEMLGVLYYQIIEALKKAA